MTNRIELNWDVPYAVDEQRYYCSETPIDVNNLPAPKAVLAGDVRTYTDIAIEVVKTYYVAVGSVKNGIEKLSTILSVITSNNPFEAFLDRSELVFWYNIQYLHTLFQDVDGLIPVTDAGQKIARINDLSGNGWHLIQPTENKRPILRLGANGYYLEFNGTSHTMYVANTNFGASTTLSLFLAQKKMQDGMSRLLLERSMSSETSDGGFNVLAPGLGGDRKYGALLGVKKVNQQQSTMLSWTASNAYSAQNSAALYVKFMIKNGSASTNLFINGIAAEQLSDDYGSTISTNFGTHNMYIGSRGDTSAFYSGNIYEIACVSRECTTAELSELQSHLIAYNES